MDWHADTSVVVGHHRGPDAISSYILDMPLSSTRHDAKARCQGCNSTADSLALGQCKIRLICDCILRGMGCVSQNASVSGRLSTISFASTAMILSKSEEVDPLD